MHCARIALDVVQSSQYVQGLCDPCRWAHNLWGRRWRCRRQGSPWRSGAGYFPRSPGCRGRCAGQGASGQRSGRGRGRTGWSGKGGRRGQRETHIMDDMQMTRDERHMNDLSQWRSWQNIMTDEDYTARSMCRAHSCSLRVSWSVSVFLLI